MNAIEYFKQNGYEHCKSILTNSGWMKVKFRLDLEDLVESHELVESYGEMLRAKAYYEKYKDMGSEENLILFSAISKMESCL